MNLMQKYQRSQSIISQSKSEDTSQSQIRKLYLSSIHKPVLNPLDPPSQPVLYKHSSDLSNAVKPISNSSRPIKLENKKSSYPNQCLTSNQTDMKNEENRFTNKNEIVDTGQNKYKQIIPICEFEKNKCSIYSKYSNDTLGEKRPNIELPQIDRLPPIFRSNSIASKEDELKFKKILKAKFDLVNTKLDFSNLEMDRPAKQIRLSTINEICQTFIGRNINFNKENGEEQLDPNKNYEIFKMIFDFLSSLIFRPTSEPFKKFTFSDDLIFISNMELGQTSLCYNALNHVLRESNLNAYSKSQLFDRKFIEKLFQRFSVPDSGERSLLAQFVLDIVNHSKENHLPFVLKKCYNELVMCSQGPYRLHYVLMPTLSILYNIFCGNVKSKEIDLSFYHNDYFCFILPVLKSLHFITCSQQMTQLIELFLSKGSEEVAFETVSALVKYFPVTKSYKSVIFISLLVTSLPLVSEAGLKRLAKGVCSIATRCTVSPNSAVSQASSSIWSIRCIENMIGENSMVLFPPIFTELKRALDEDDTNFLNEAVIGDVMARLERLDANVFSQLNSGKKDLRKSGAIEGRDHLRREKAGRVTIASWRLIAREAARKDCEIDLGGVLTEIGQFFVEDESLSKFEGKEKSEFTPIQAHHSSKTSMRVSQPRSAPQTKGKFMSFLGWMSKFSKNKNNH